MSRLRVPVNREDHIAGRPDAPIQLVEYGDYQCPYCGRASAELKKLRAALGDQLGYVFRHFPLTQVHPYSLLAAEAAEAAGAQGKFWEMHDMLFDNQDALDRESLLAYASDLGLDLNRFVLDLEEHRFLDRIHRDFIGGARSGVGGTPTFFINGELYLGDNTAEALLAAIQGQPVEAAR